MRLLRVGRLVLAVGGSLTLVRLCVRLSSSSSRRSCALHSAQFVAMRSTG